MTTISSFLVISKPAELQPLTGRLSAPILSPQLPPESLLPPLLGLVVLVAALVIAAGGRGHGVRGFLVDLEEVEGLNERENTIRTKLKLGGQGLFSNYNPFMIITKCFRRISLPPPYFIFPS